MTPIIPDTLEGALILSVIDFFLSFVIISGIGIVLALFPLLNRVAQVRLGRPPATATALDDKVDIEAEDHIVAIAAAVYDAMQGAPHRIVHIEDVNRAALWRAEGRFTHHASHRPPRAGRQQG